MQKTIKELQVEVGFPTMGIFEQSMLGTSMETLLHDYAQKVDEVLITQYGNRILREELNTTDLISVFIRADMLSSDYKWKGLIESTTFEYNPTENYNMVEKSVVIDTKDEKTENHNTLNNGERVTNDTATTLRSPYDNDAFFNDAQQTTTATENASVDTTETNNNFTADNKSDRELTRSGNIGVTTTQEMIIAQRKVVDYSVVKQMAQSVANIISVGVYYA